MADDGLVEVLAEFARTMVTDFPIQAILDRLVERIVEVLPVTAAGVTLISLGKSPVYVAASDADALRFEALQSSLGEGPCLSACVTGEPVSVPDVRGDPRFAKFSPAAARSGLGAVFAFPLRHGDDPLGALDLYCDKPTELSPLTMNAASTLADVAAAYILNARARAELLTEVERARAWTRRDELTGLANRVSLLEDLGRALRQAGRPGRSVTVLFADIDRFKEVNDLHGHRTGDELLVAVAARLLALVRPGDTVARLSGDEFVLVCLDLADIIQVESIARRAIGGLSMPFVLSEVVVASTASVGVVYTTADDRSPGDLLHAADMAMYEAKRQGRGSYHLVTFEPAPSHGSDLALDNDTQRLARIQILAAEQERARLARELHDHVGQSLVYIGLELDRLANTNAGRATGTEIVSLRTDLTRLVSELRDTLEELGSDVSEENDLTTALTASRNTSGAGDASKSR